MATADRVLPWRRVGSGRRRRRCASCVDVYRAKHPKADTTLHHPGLRGGRRGPRGPGAPLGRALHHPPAGRGHHPRRPRPRRRHPRRRPPARRGRGHRRHPRRRRQATSAPRWRPSSTASPSSTGSASTPRRPSRPPPCARCSWPWPRTSGSCSSSWPTGSTTCARSPPCPTRSSSASPRRRSTSTPRWPTASASQDIKLAAGGPGLRHPLPEALRRDRADGVDAGRPSATSTSARSLDMVKARLAELRIDAEVTGRPKHYWSIYEKMVVKGREFDDIYDLVGIRVLVGSVKDCYAALGAIHATWKPVQGRFKDYIAMPKFNLYQSLHTTVVGPQGKPLEVQIRTREMHQRAEFGIAAHWGYKEKSARSPSPAGCQRIVDWQRETDRPGRVPGDAQARPRPGRGLRLHPQGRRDHPARWAPRPSTSPTPSTPTSATAASAPGSTAGWCRSTRAVVGRHGRGLHVQGGGGGPVARLAQGRGHAPGPQQDPPVVQPQPAGGGHRERPGGPGQATCAGRASRCRS